MSLFENDPQVDIAVASGTLRITVHGNVNRLAVLAEIAFVGGLAFWLSQNWSAIQLKFRILWVWGLLAGAVGFVLQSISEETIEFDERKLTLCRGFHGWERRREYDISECSQLEWRRSEHNSPRGLQCRTGWKTLRFAKQISEEQSIRILTELQRALPNVANQILSMPEGKKHFVTLNLS